MSYKKRCIQEIFYFLFIFIRFKTLLSKYWAHFNLNCVFVIFQQCEQDRIWYNIHHKISWKMIYIGKIGLNSTYTVLNDILWSKKCAILKIISSTFVTIIYWYIDILLLCAWISVVSINHRGSVRAGRMLSYFVGIFFVFMLFWNPMFIHDGKLKNQSLYWKSYKSRIIRTRLFEWVQHRIIYLLYVPNWCNVSYYLLFICPGEENRIGNSENTIFFFGLITISYKITIAYCYNKYIFTSSVIWRIILYTI